MSKKIAVGIDIGGTNTVYGFIENSGKVIEYVEIPTRGHQPINDLLTRLDSRTAPVPLPPLTVILGFSWYPMPGATNLTSLNDPDTLA